MPVTYVQGNSNQANGNASTWAVTLGAAVTSGNTVVGGVTVYNPSAASLTSVTDDKGNTYNIVGCVPGFSGQTQCWGFWLNNITNAPITLTATFSASVQFNNILADEFTPTGALDVSISNYQTSPPLSPTTDGMTSTAATTTAADLVYGVYMQILSGHVVAGTGFTGAQISGGSSNQMGSEFLIQGGAGSATATFTNSLSSSDVTTLMMAFLPAGGGAPAGVPFTRRDVGQASADDAQPSLRRNLSPSITGVAVNNPPPANKFATALLAALTAWGPVDNLPILPVKRVPPTVIVSTYLPKRPALDSSAWNPSDPQPIVARNLAPQLTAVRVDQPPIPTPENFWNGYASWVPGDPQPPVGPKGVFPGAAAVAGVPYSRASASTILASWIAPDGPPTLAGKLSAQTLAVPVNNPPGKTRLTDYSAWQAPDASPTMPRYAPQQPVVVVSFNPSTRAWLTSVISTWQPDDAPQPTLRAKLTPPSVDNPPRLVRQAWFAPPDDPLPTIGARFVRQTPAIVNNPPFAQPPQFAVIANSWVAPDPQPTLTTKLPSALAAVAVNNPPVRLRQLPPGVFDAWAPIDPLPALRARGTFGNVVFGVAGQQRWSLATVRTIASTAKRLSYYPASVRTLQVMNMPYVGTDFSIADPGALEQDIYRFNATPRLASDGSETLTGPGTWVVAVVSGVDASPMTRIIGSPTLLNGVVSQMIGNLVAGVKYLIQVTVTTSTGRVLTAYSHVMCSAPT